MAYHLAGSLMLGGVIPWYKSFGSTPALKPDFVECNGQTLSDAQSIFDGQTIPNLNGSGGGSQRWLRGSTTSGSTGGNASHTHINTLTAGNVGMGCCITICPKFNWDSQPNLAPYFENVFVMRIK